jgi:peroxiredoxin
MDHVLMYETFELGPIVNNSVDDFTLPDHTRTRYSLKDMMGSTGAILGFIGDIWHPASVRRILWLQRHVQKFASMGAPITLIIREDPMTLEGFRLSSPLPVPFPLLADIDGAVHQLYSMDRHPGLLLIDHNHILRDKWLMPDERVWPKLEEITRSVHSVQVYA